MIDIKALRAIAETASPGSHHFPSSTVLELLDEVEQLRLRVDAAPPGGMLLALRNDVAGGSVHAEPDEALPGSREGRFRIVRDEDTRRYRDDYKTTARPQYLATVYSREVVDFYVTCHNHIPSIIGLLEKLTNERDAANDAAHRSRCDLLDQQTKYDVLERDFDRADREHRRISDENDDLKVKIAELRVDHLVLARLHVERLADVQDLTDKLTSQMELRDFETYFRESQVNLEDAVQEIGALEAKLAESQAELVKARDWWGGPVAPLVVEMRSEINALTAKLAAAGLDARYVLDIYARSLGEPSDWKGDSFKTLAKDDPQRLIQLVAAQSLADHDLTFAAEALGFVPDQAVVVAVLGWLAVHKSPVVREGVVYGLARHVTTSDAARAIVQQLAARDPSPGVRSSAEEALEAGAVPSENFEKAWARFEEYGYRYGGDALESVRFGFAIARGKTPGESDREEHPTLREQIDTLEAKLAEVQRENEHLTEGIVNTNKAWLVTCETLTAKLAAMTAARDEACDLLDNAADPGTTPTRVAELRAIGGDKP